MEENLGIFITVTHIFVFEPIISLQEPKKLSAQTIIGSFHCNTKRLEITHIPIIKRLVE